MNESEKAGMNIIQSRCFAAHFIYTLSKMSGTRVQQKKGLSNFQQPGSNSR